MSTRRNSHSLLSLGLATADSYLYESMTAEGGPTVGFIWFAVEQRHGLRSAHVNDDEIKEEYRRQGHAKIEQYHLTIPIPNEPADEGVKRIRAGR